MREVTAPRTRGAWHRDGLRPGHGTRTGRPRNASSCMWMVRHTAGISKRRQAGERCRHCIGRTNDEPQMIRYTDGSPGPHVGIRPTSVVDRLSLERPVRKISPKDRRPGPAVAHCPRRTSDSGGRHQGFTIPRTAVGDPAQVRDARARSADVDRSLFHRSCH